METMLLTRLIEAYMAARNRYHKGIAHRLAYHILRAILVNFTDVKPPANDYEKV